MDAAELQESIAATRSVVKATIRTCRGCLQMLADLERRLEETTQSLKEAERNEQHNDDVACNGRHRFEHQPAIIRA